MCLMAIRVAKTDPDQAIRWDRRAAELGYSGSMYNLGARLTASMPVEARRWWERAAEAGHAGSMRELGNYWRTLDPAQARRWYQRAAAAGDSYAMIRMGQLLDPLDIGPRFGRRTLQEAQQWYEKAAALGEPRAQHMLGWRIVQWDCWGARITSSQRREAQRWLEAAAAQGDGYAALLLGQILRVNNDLHAAFRWLEHGAQHGSGACAMLLGLMTSPGDPERGSSHLDQARELGLPATNNALRAVARRMNTLLSWLGRRWPSKGGKAVGAERPVPTGPFPSSRRYWALVGLTGETIRLVRRCVRLALTKLNK